MTAQVQILDQSNNPAGTPSNPLSVSALGNGGASLALDSTVQGVATAVQGVQTAVQQLHADLTSTNSALASINSAVGNVLNAVNAVTTATNAVQSAVASGNASSATIASQTASLTSALASIQSLITAGNTALGTLRADGLNLQSLVTTGNTALAAIQTATQAGATAANQATMISSLAALNTAATTELSTLNTIASDITALGVTLGGGATLAQVVAAMNPLATSANISALQSALTTIESNELTQLTAIAAATPPLNSDGGVPSHVTNWPATQTVAGAVAITNLPTGGQQVAASQAVAISFEQFNVLVELLTQIAQECALTNVMLANELRVKEDLSSLRQDSASLQ